MRSSCSVALFALAAIGVWSGPLHAAQSVSISVAQNLSFPTIAIPQSGTTALAVSALNSSTSGTATVLFGTASRGEYDLSVNHGGSAISASVDITNVSVSNPNVTLTNFTGFYNNTTISSFPSPTLPLPSQSPSFTPLYLGATIGASPSVTPGSYTASFTITVTIQ